MDPIEKKFQEAFADYPLPVEDGLWDQVLEKKNRRKPFPWMRLAAAIALLILAGVLLWPEQGTAPAALVETTTPMNHEAQQLSSPVDVPVQNEAESLQPEVVVQQKAHIQRATPVAVAMDPSHPHFGKDVEPVEQNVNIEYADLPQLNRLPLDRVHHTSAPVALPLPEVYWAPLQATEQTEVAATPAAQTIKRTQTDLTGPARLVNILEKNSPKLVKDIIAFGSARSTEIEINW
ncbi:MAG: hypothetical protein K9I85_04860 [Saprospiraceae bacterium]|nr:hypothetical protein [Saprospiraceae bacterium]